MHLQSLSQFSGTIYFAQLDLLRTSVILRNFKRLIAHCALTLLKMYFLNLHLTRFMVLMVFFIILQVFMFTSCVLVVNVIGKALFINLNL